jgi:peptidoglycan/xylan/chitin deacetylase (PgdA/CDA1 family)
MYHYVREIKKSKFPNLRGLEFSDFKKQINFFKKKFNILNQNSFIKIIQSRKIPKKPSILLTFDDGYHDHYKYVFPYLLKEKISGIFYPCIESIRQKKILNVNMIHFILEKEKDKKKILDLINFYLFKFYNSNLDNYNLKKIKLHSRYDDKTTILIKRLLQNFLPEKIRTKILTNIFNDIVDIDKLDFCKELYLNKEQIKEMSDNKMNFGIHGNNHTWLQYLNKKEQEKEIIKSKLFFERNNINKKNLSLCYPYGSFNKVTLSIAKKEGVKFAFTTQNGGVNQNNIEDIYTLPRVDTNELKNFN